MPLSKNTTLSEVITAAHFGASTRFTIANGLTVEPYDIGVVVSDCPTSCHVYVYYNGDYLGSGIFPSSETIGYCVMQCIIFACKGSDNV